jgi:hypothetical protein
MAYFRAGGALALIVLTAADPTSKPTTAPPSLRPTAPSPRPTSSTPQPTDLIRILEQDVQSAPFDLPSNTCAAFQVLFEGGSDRKLRVEITDTEKGLNYVAAGLAFYNKNEVYGDPFTLAKCDSDFDYDAQSPQPQCWGPDSSAVDVSGYKDRGDCSGDVDAFKKDLGDDVVTTFAFRASNTNNCRTSSGDYYLYVYAQRRTSVSFLVTAAKSSCGGNNKKAKKVSLTLLAILLPIAFCIAIIVCVAYCGWATWENCKPSNHRPTEYPSEEPVFDTPATGQLDQPVSAGYGHGTPVASAPPVEQSSGWTWSKATPAQQAQRFNMCQ